LLLVFEDSLSAASIQLMHVNDPPKRSSNSPLRYNRRPFLDKRLGAVARGSLLAQDAQKIYPTMSGDGGVAKASKQRRSREVTVHSSRKEEEKRKASMALEKVQSKLEKAKEAETYADQDPLALDVDISDGELAGQRHFA
jgi:hypothetical protein